MSEYTWLRLVLKKNIFKVFFIGWFCWYQVTKKSFSWCHFLSTFSFLVLPNALSITFTDLIWHCLSHSLFQQYTSFHLFHWNILRFLSQLTLRGYSETGTWCMPSFYDFWKCIRHHFLSTLTTLVLSFFLEAFTSRQNCHK